MWEFGAQGGEEGEGGHCCSGWGPLVAAKRLRGIRDSSSHSGREWKMSGEREEEGIDIWNGMLWMGFEALRWIICSRLRSLVPGSC